MVEKDQCLRHGTHIKIHNQVLAQLALMLGELNFHIIYTKQFLRLQSLQQKSTLGLTDFCFPKVRHIWLDMAKNKFSYKYPNLTVSCEIISSRESPRTV